MVSRGNVTYLPTYLPTCFGEVGRYEIDCFCFWFSWSTIMHQLNKFQILILKKMGKFITIWIIKRLRTMLVLIIYSLACIINFRIFFNFFFVNYNKDFRYLGPTTQPPSIYLAFKNIYIYIIIFKNWNKSFMLFVRPYIITKEEAPLNVSCGGLEDTL
jgi:hypothetical protein